MSAKLYDHNKGEWVEVPSDQVDDSVLSGRYTFPQGTQVPIVTFDGSLATVPSEEAYAAFADGTARWQTQSDRERDWNTQQEIIKERNFGGEMGTAAAMGALDSALLGAGGVGARVASEITGDPSILEAANEVKTRNPGSYIAGSVAGLVIPTPVVKGASSLRNAPAVVREAVDVGRLGAEAVQASRASQVVARLTDRTLGSAMEGAVYGLGSGISEASLGRSDEVVDNLLSHTGMGALIGGGAGAAFGLGAEAAPYLKKAIDPALDAGTNLAKRAARGVTSSIVKPVLSVHGERELAEKFPEMIGNEKFMALVRSGDMQSAKQLAKEASSARDTYARESAKMQDDLVRKLKSTTKENQRGIVAEMSQASGDIRQAISNINQRTARARDQFEAALGTQDFRGVDSLNWLKVEKAANETADAIRSSGVRGADGIAADIVEKIKSYHWSGLNPSQADEGRALMSLYDTGRQLAQNPKYADAGRNLIKSVSTVAEKSEIPAFKDAVVSIFRPQSAADDLVTMVAKSGGKGSEGMIRILESPDKMQAVRPFLESASEFAPELKAYTSAGSWQEKARILKDARAKMSEMYQRSVDGKLSIDDVDQLFRMLTPDRGDIHSVIGKVKEASDLLRGSADMDPWSQAALFLRATGKNVDALERAIPFKDHIVAWDRLNELGIKVPEAAQWAARAVGYKVGGPIGGAVVEGAISLANPLQAVRTLGSIEKMANKGRQAFDRATNSLMNTLTSGEFDRSIAIGERQTRDTKSKQGQFKKLQKQLADLSTPDGVMNKLSQASGELQGVPALKLEMQIRLQGAVAFLNAKMPQDPLAGFAVGPTNWSPSDKDLNQFFRYVEAVDNPVSVVKKCAQGTVTPEEVETLKMVYPDMYQRLQALVMDGIMAKGADVPYKSKLLLGQIFDVPTDYTLTPDFILAMQSSFQSNDQGAQGPQTVERPKTKLNTNPLATVATEAAKVSEGDYQS